MVYREYCVLIGVDADVGVTYWEHCVLISMGVGVRVDVCGGVDGCMCECATGMQPPIAGAAFSLPPRALCWSCWNMLHWIQSNMLSTCLPACLPSPCTPLLPLSSILPLYPLLPLLPPSPRMIAGLLQAGMLRDARLLCAACGQGVTSKQYLCKVRVG
jgi:hypothetical protein